MRNAMAVRGPPPGTCIHHTDSIERPSHRVTGNRRDSVDGADRETLFVAIDDHARITFTDVHPDEKTPQACSSCTTRLPTTAA